MYAFCSLLIKIVLTLIILAIIILCIFHIFRRWDLEAIATKQDIDTLYDKIQYGDILTLRLGSLVGRIAFSPIATFFHYVIVVKLPNDDNKYILHTRNKSIRKVIYPDLKTNVVSLGIKNGFQLVHLKEYLSYIKSKNEFITHLHTHNDCDYTLDYEAVNHLPEWKSYFRQHCGYLIATYMCKMDWSCQDMHLSKNITYYSPDAIQDRFIEYDNYTYEGILYPI